RHVVSSLDKPQRLVFFGASGGGFAALYYSYFFPGSLALPMNPQTILANYSPRPVTEYTATAWGAEDIKDAPILSDLRELYAEGLPNTVGFIQNVQDTHHRDRHAAPWVRGLPPMPSRLHM